METVRWGIIGAGDVVQRKSGPALLAEPRSTIAAITRRDPLACGAEVFADADALINEAAVDAIYIATPPDTHEALTLAALRAGKPIVVEKPLAPDLAGARRMVRRAEEASVSLSVAYYRRYDPRLVRVMSLIEAGTIGAVEAVEIRQIRADGESNPPQGWRADPMISPGGRFSDSHAHALDWLTHAFGPVRLVAGAPARMGLVAYALQLRDAPVAGVFDPRGPAPIDQLKITGGAGMLTLPFFDPGPIRITVAGGHYEVEMSPPAYPHLPYFSAMAAHVLDGGAVPAPAQEAIAATEIIRKLFAA